MTQISPKDQELAAAAKTRLEQTGMPPRPDELAAIDRILIEQARVRIARSKSFPGETFLGCAEDGRTRPPA